VLEELKKNVKPDEGLGALNEGLLALPGADKGFSGEKNVSHVVRFKKGFIA